MSRCTRFWCSVITETARHTGHADILRQEIDGQAGMRADNTNLPDADRQWWSDYVEKLRRTADQVDGVPLKSDTGSQHEGGA